jgi:hypothetical protein
MRVQDSHSATVPVMRSECGMAGPMRAPILVCTRTQGSNGSPSGRVQRAYRSIGIVGYRSLWLGRTGAIRWLSPASHASADIALSSTPDSRRP